MTISVLRSRRLCYLTLCAALLGIWGAPARPSHASGVADDESIVSFARLGVTEKSLRGPFDSAYIDFSLPANWKLNAGAQIQLHLNTFFAGASATGYHNGQPFGGMLQVMLNNVTLSTVLAVLGSTDQGLIWAGAALTTPKQRVALTGNLAMIHDEQIDSHDTRPKMTAAPTPQPAATTTQPEEAKRPNIFLLLAASVVALIVLGGAISLVVWWRRRGAQTQRAGDIHDHAEAK